MPYVILNNQLIDAAKAVISVDDRGFRFGDGVFETIGVHGGVPYQFDWHAERLRKGLNAIKINANLHTLNEQCRKLLKENKVERGILRIQVTRGSGSRGYLPVSTTPPTILIETKPQPVIDGSHIALWISAIQKLSPQMLPVQYKLCQGLSSTLARMEADENHCADALLLNAKGEICETSSGNIFWVNNDILYTPALTCGVLEGAMRATVMRLSPYKVQETKATLEELRAASEVFITNAVWGILSVGALKPGTHTWPQTTIADSLRKALTADIDAYTQDNKARW